MVECITHDQLESLDAGSVPEPEQTLLGWSASLRVLSDEETWRAAITGAGIGAVAVGVLAAAFAENAMAFLVGGLGGFAILMAVFEIAGVVVDLRGGLHFSYALTAEGIRGHAPAGRVLWMPYAEVTRVTCDPAHHYLEVEGAFLTDPIALYCTPDNFARVTEILRARCPGTRFEDRAENRAGGAPCTM